MGKWCSGREGSEASGKGKAKSWTNLPRARDNPKRTRQRKKRAHRTPQTSDEVFFQRLPQAPTIDVDGTIPQRIQTSHEHGRGVQRVVDDQIHAGEVARQAANIPQHIPRQEEVSRDAHIRCHGAHFLTRVENHSVMTGQDLGRNAELGKKTAALVGGRPNGHVGSAFTVGISAEAATRRKRKTKTSRATRKRSCVDKEFRNLNVIWGRRSNKPPKRTSGPEAVARSIGCPATKSNDVIPIRTSPPGTPRCVI